PTTSTTSPQGAASMTSVPPGVAAAGAAVAGGVEGRMLAGSSDGAGEGGLVRLRSATPPTAASTTTAARPTPLPPRTRGPAAAPDAREASATTGCGTRGARVDGCSSVG